MVSNNSILKVNYVNKTLQKVFNSKNIHSLKKNSAWLNLKTQS